MLYRASSTSGLDLVVPWQTKIRDDQKKKKKDTETGAYIRRPEGSVDHEVGQQ